MFIYNIYHILIIYYISYIIQYILHNIYYILYIIMTETLFILYHHIKYLNGNK